MPRDPLLTCPSVLPVSADAPHEGTGWSGPVRCVMTAEHGGDLCWNGGIAWRTPTRPSDPVGPACAVDAHPDTEQAEHESCADLRIADEGMRFPGDWRWTP